MIGSKKTGKGWKKMGASAKKETAMKKAREVEERMKTRGGAKVVVTEGVHNSGGGLGVKPKTQKVWRVWVKA
jgi:hypothetical protein